MINDIELFKNLGFSYENGKVSKQLSDKCILQRDVNRTEWSVDVVLTNGGVNTIPATAVKDEEMAEKIRQEIAKVNRALNGIPEEIQEAVFEEDDIVESVAMVTLPAPTGGIVRPAVSAQEAVAAWREFQQLKKCILSKTDLVNIQGKDRIVKSGWRKFATFYNLTDRIVDEIKEDLGNNAFSWKMKVICTAPNGRQTEGIAICTSTEKKFAHPEHDVYTTCHTRAKNRAISDMIAAGEVSAEELMDGGMM